MNDLSVKEKILKTVGKQVKYTYPSPELPRVGILKDRIVIQSDSSPSGVQYWDVVDLIVFPEEEWIRIGYYRKLKDRLVFAGQTTITEPIRIWKRILTQAAKEKSWFRNLLLEVVMELDK